MTLSKTTFIFATTLVALVLLGGGGQLNAQIDADAVYERGMDELDDGEWRKAAVTFDELARNGGRRAAAALYWKAYALYKRAQLDDAGDAIEQLRADYPDSRWNRDADALEVEMGGAVRPGGEEDLELKLLALESLIHADPDRAMPILKQILEGDHHAELKERALFVLLQSGHPEALGIVGGIARNERGDPDLREEAVLQLGIAGGDRSYELLQEIYRSATNEDIKEAVLQALMFTGRSDLILEIAGSDPSEDMREEAIQVLGQLGAIEELENLYASERSEEVKESLLEAFMIAGARDPILRAAREDPSEELRGEAVQLLGMMGAQGELWEIYQNEKSEDVREEILQGFMIAGDKRRLLAIAREDSSAELRGDAVQLLGAMGARDELKGLFSEEQSTEVRESILEGFMMMGDTDTIFDVARNEPDEELREDAIQLLGVMNAQDELRQLFGEETSEDLREDILEAMFLAGDLSFLEEVARGDRSRELREAAISAIGMSGSRRASEALVEIYENDGNHEIKKAVLEALFAQGNVQQLLRMARGETDSELRLEAVRYLSHMGSEEAEEFMLELLEED